MSVELLATWLKIVDDFVLVHDQPGVLPSHDEEGVQCNTEVLVMDLSKTEAGLSILYVSTVRSPHQLPT
jgi:hypothetical protein